MSWCRDTAPQPGTPGGASDEAITMLSALTGIWNPPETGCPTYSTEEEIFYETHCDLRRVSLRGNRIEMQQTCLSYEDSFDAELKIEVRGPGRISVNDMAYGLCPQEQ